MNVRRIPRVLQLLLLLRSTSPVDWTTDQELLEHLPGTTHERTLTYTPLYTHPHTSTHTHTHTCAPTHTHTHIYTHTYTHKHTHCIYACVQYMHICVYARFSLLLHVYSV